MKSWIKKLAALLILSGLSLAGGASFAVEFQVLDRFSVDGYTEFRGSAAVASGLFTVGGSTFVVKGGSVGIGTAYPLTQFHVDGNATSLQQVFLRNSSSDASAQGYLTFSNAGTGFDVGLYGYNHSVYPNVGFLRGSGLRFEATSAGGNMDLLTNSILRLRIDPSGNVGIGTTNPGYLLHVKNGSSSGYIVVERGGTSPSQLLFGAITGAARIYARDGGTGDVPLYFQTGTTDRMTIDASGKVGIGTTAPGYRLDVNGTLGVTQPATFGNTVGLFGSSAQLYIGSAGTAGNFSTFIWNDTSKALEITGTYTGGSPDMTIKSGNVGIGTAAPVLGRLVVNNITDFTNTFFQVGANSGGSAEGVIVNDDRGFAGVNSGRSFVVRTRDDGANDTGAIADFRTVGGTDASRFYVGISGNVGIGTAGPGAKLDVAGDIKASGGGTFYLTNDNFLRMTSWMNCVARAAIAGKVVALITWPKAGQTVSCNSLCATAVGPNSTTGYTCIGGGYFGYSPTQNTSTQGSIGERISWGACETSFGPASSYGYNSSMGRYMTGEDGTSNGHVCCCGGAGE